VDRILKDKKKLIEEDPLFIHPAEVKRLLEEYEPVDMCLRPAPVVLHLDGLRVKIGFAEHHKDIENMEIYGRKIGEICRLSPSKINDSSIIIRIKTRSEVAHEDSMRGKA
jgi:methyl coenzyme M reductase subunit C-like uncharacterized protein (methanogenesis marker protein 7)